MVAIIKTGSSIHRTFNYNENKVKDGVAKCIGAANYPKDVSQLSVSNKLNRLLNQAALNENVKRNSVHISLNFNPSESFSENRLNEIADMYMQKIGFGNQPYLVYQHNDSGHPHIHIVSIKIRSDGRRIDTQNIGRNQSEKARKEIEETFGLVKAEGSKQQHAYDLKPVNVQKAIYGKTETKRAITNVLEAVLKNYKYSSLPELNAVLQQYNVVADRGGENSRIYTNRGLVYRMLDEQGNKMGVPIKASDFYNKPTLKFLEFRFKQNETEKHQYKTRIKNTIDLLFYKLYSPTLDILIQEFAKEGIYTALRKNEAGVIYGITYVDNINKCVFNGSALGKEYSAKAIQDRCDNIERVNKIVADSKGKPALTHRSKPANELASTGNFPQEDHRKVHPESGLLNTIPQSENTSDYVSHHFKKKGKRKKKRNSKRM